MSEEAQILILKCCFWLVVASLDLLGLWALRHRKLPATATVLWVVWIVIAPVVGVLSFYMVNPQKDPT